MPSSTASSASDSLGYWKVFRRRAAAIVVFFSFCVTAVLGGVRRKRPMDQMSSIMMGIVGSVDCLLDSDETISADWDLVGCSVFSSRSWSIGAGDVGRGGGREGAWTLELPFRDQLLITPLFT